MYRTDKPLLLWPHDVQASCLRMTLHHMFIILSEISPLSEPLTLPDLNNRQQIVKVAAGWNVSASQAAFLCGMGLSHINSVLVGMED